MMIIRAQKRQSKVIEIQEIMITSTQNMDLIESRTVQNEQDI